MIIHKIHDGNALTVTLGGRLDTSTAPELESFLKENVPGIKSLMLD